MGEVTITINNRAFKLGCDDGEEEHLVALADHLGKHVEQLRKTIGKVGDEQLFLMAGLMVCDELWEARDLLIKTREMLKNQAATKERMADIALKKATSEVAVKGSRPEDRTVADRSQPVSPQATPSTRPDPS